MNKCDTSCFEYLENRKLRRQAERLVYKCGVRADLKGCKCLVDSVILYSMDTAMSFYAIYERIGAYRNIKAKTVLREISYCIAQARNIASQITALIGCRVAPSDIHSSLVIAYLGKQLEIPERTEKQDDD